MSSVKISQPLEEIAPSIIKSVKHLSKVKSWIDYMQFEMTLIYKCYSSKHQSNADSVVFKIIVQL